MKPLSSAHAAAVLTGILIVGHAPPTATAEQNRLEVLGVYRYAYQEPVSLADAKKIACAEAIRLSVDSSRFFMDATSHVIDPPFLRDLAQKIISGSLKDVQIIEQSDKGQTVSCRVRSYLDQEEVRAVIVSEITRGQAGEPPGLDQNRTLKILSVQEGKEGTVVVVYKALKRLDWLSTAYDGSLRETADVMIEYYNEQGIPVGADRHPARLKPDGTEVMNPGEISSRTFRKPPGTKSYRVWIVK
ncbi:MAG: hypothetical protein EXR97_04180 [Nitrospiraceae bacterium]|nr:hypothetical protein [Nitrospiraceae bacterium]MSR24963.1 hypothetical protein [Nitrospiraceae bacterium]